MVRRCSVSTVCMGQTKTQPAMVGSKEERESCESIAPVKWLSRVRRFPPTQLFRGFLILKNEVPEPVMKKFPKPVAEFAPA